MKTLKTFKGILTESPEVPGDIEQRLIDMHQIDMIDYHIPQEHVFKGTIQQRPRKADVSKADAEKSYDSFQAEAGQIGPGHSILDEAPGRFKRQGDKELYQWGDVNEALMKAGASMRVISSVMTALSKKSTGLHEDQHVNESLLAEGPSDKWISVLNSAIKKNANNPEFMQFKNRYEAWADEYERVHQSLVKAKGVPGKMFSAIFGALGIKEEYEQGAERAITEENVESAPQMLEESNEIKEFRSMTPMRDKFGPAKKDKKDKKDTKKEGNAFGKALMAARDKGDKDFVVAGKSYKVEDYDDNVAEESKTPIKMQLKLAKLNEKYKPGKLKLKSKETVNISKQDSDLLNGMLKDMSSNNRKEMEKVLQKDKSGFEEILGFAREAL